MPRKDGLIARLDLRLKEGVEEDETVARAITEVRRARGIGSTAQTLRVLIVEEQKRLNVKAK